MTSTITPPCITAYVICHTPDGPRYLLIRRCCGGYLNGTWQMVTGGTMEGETASQTALREIEEETGLIPTKLYSADAVETFYLHAQNKIILVPVFVAFVEEMEVRLAAQEHDVYEWLPFEESKKRLVWAEQQRIIAHVHERFVLKNPDDILLIDISHHPI
jgi:dihydroneopterin triphosphate diphosphatase